MTRTGAAAALAAALVACGGVNQVVQRCDGGDGLACADLARRADEGDGILKDPPRATAWRARACEAGVVPECRRAGFAYAYGVGVPFDLDRAGKLLEKGCEAGDVRACNWAGAIQVPVNGFLGDGVRALRLFEHACHHGSTAGCYNAARRYERGDVEGADAQRTVDYYRRAAELSASACGDAPDPLDCYAVGFMAENGRGLPADLARAAGAYERACAAGDPFGCVRFARLVELGAWRPPAGEEVRPGEVLRKACDDGAFDGCEAIAEAAARQGGAVYGLPAQGWLERACEHGGARACFRAAEAFADSSPEKAGALFQRGCAARDARGCAEVARRTEAGDGVVPSARKAADLWARLCEARDLTACRSASRLHGQGGPDLRADPKRARAFLEKACGLGDVPACEETALPQ